MPEVKRYYARVSLQASLVLTVPIPVDATKPDIRKQVLDGLRLITNADDAILCKIPENYSQYNAKVYPPKKDEKDIEENTLFTLKGLQLLDLFNEIVDEEPTFT